MEGVPLAGLSVGVPLRTRQGRAVGAGSVTDGPRAQGKRGTGPWREGARESSLGRSQPGPRGGSSRMSDRKRHGVRKGEHRGKGVRVLPAPTEARRGPAGRTLVAALGGEKAPSPVHQHERSKSDETAFTSMDRPHRHGGPHHLGLRRVPR